MLKATVVRRTAFWSAGVLLLLIGGWIVTVLVIQDRSQEERDRRGIERIYRGPAGERVTRIRRVGTGRYDVTRETSDGSEFRFRIVRSGSNLVPADDQPFIPHHPNPFPEQNPPPAAH